MGECEVCSEGYTVATDDYPLNKNCTKCNSPCLACYGDPDFCFACESGYSLLGSKCIYNFNFVFEVVFEANGVELYENYPALAEAVVQQVGLNSTDYFFTTSYTNVVGTNHSLFSGIVQSCMDPREPIEECFTNKYAAFESLFNGSMVANMTVGSYSTAKVESGFASCAWPCLHCNMVGSSNCLSCVEGYSLRGQACLLNTCTVPYCSQCLNAFTCQRCQPTFLLSDNQCICPNDHTILMANTVNASCVCPAGFNCTTCHINHCLTCSNATTCT